MLRSATQPGLNGMLVAAATAARLSSGRPADLLVFPVLYGRFWPGMIPQGQLLSSSQETIDNLNK
jgi:hypothetical protein